MFRLLTIACLLAVTLMPSDASAQTRLTTVRVVATEFGSVPPVYHDRTIVKASWNTCMCFVIHTKAYGWVQLQVCTPSQKVVHRTQRTGQTIVQFDDRSRILITEQYIRDAGRYALLVRYRT